MKDGKLIVFTKHARERCLQRLRMSSYRASKRFSEAIRYDYHLTSKGMFSTYIDENGIQYITKEEKERFVILTLYEKELAPIKV